MPQNTNPLQLPGPVKTSFRRGTLNQLPGNPVLDVGEPAYLTDEETIALGNGGNDPAILLSSYNRDVIYNKLYVHLTPRATGSNSIYNLDLTDTVSLTSYYKGLQLTFIPNHDNGDCVFIDVNNIGQRKLVDYYKNELKGGELKKNSLTRVMYDGSQFQLLDVINAGALQTGEKNEMENVGIGKGVFHQKINETFQLKSLFAGDGISIFEQNDMLTIKADVTADQVGEINTAKNIGNGQGVFYQKLNGEFQFFSLVNGEGIDILQNQDTISLSVDIPELINNNCIVANGNNLGSGMGVFKDKTNGVANFYSLNGKNGIVLQKDNVNNVIDIKLDSNVSGSFSYQFLGGSSDKEIVKDDGTDTLKVKGINSDSYISVTNSNNDTKLNFNLNTGAVKTFLSGDTNFANGIIDSADNYNPIKNTISGDTTFANNVINNADNYDPIKTFLSGDTNFANGIIDSADNYDSIKNNIVNDQTFINNISADGGAAGGEINNEINNQKSLTLTTNLQDVALDDSNSIIITSIHAANISSDRNSEPKITARVSLNSGNSILSLGEEISVTKSSAVELLYRPNVLKSGDKLKLSSTDSNSIDVIITYINKSDNSFVVSGTNLTDSSGSKPVITVSNKSVIDSILVSNKNLNNTSRFSVKLTDGQGNKKAYIVNEMDIPENSTIEIISNAKYLDVNDKLIGECQSGSVDIIASGINI